MAGPRFSPLLILLLSLALGAAGLEANNTGERIINGFLCPKGKQPWQVALFEGHKFHCSGVLLSELWVLTVAHCHLSEYLVQMGSDILLHGDGQRIRATKSFIHPRFSEVTHVNDLMLVKLSAPAPLSSTVKIISVSSQCKPPGTKCTVSGWGSIAMDIVTYPKALMCSHVSIYPYMYCKRTFPTISRRYMTCAAPPNRLSYMCKLDSGNPLMCGGSLQGLLSSAYFPCRPPFDPIIYIRLCKYHKWIYETMKTPAKDMLPPPSTWQPPEAPRDYMAGPHLSPLLILLLSLALGAAGLEDEGQTGKPDLAPGPVTVPIFSL
ncbi:kallikrein-7-like [Phyllostomus hastatus]|uniref:kallikrein-7-like n=1 Tax=Phyllostomus hastatus TaxID=9423 RepID=UPI001E681EC6|nr:kallikrein-7-like [Phyllostomus hastatus]